MADLSYRTVCNRCNALVEVDTDGNESGHAVPCVPKPEEPAPEAP